MSQMLVRIDAEMDEALKAIEKLIDPYFAMKGDDLSPVEKIVKGVYVQWKSANDSGLRCTKITIDSEHS